MKQRKMRSDLVLGLILLAGVLGVAPLIWSADQPINLDENTANGSESRVSTKVLSTYPVRIENTIYNNAPGQSFTFRWPGAGPGGFSSFLAAGPGVGTVWTWTTVYQVYSIDSPIDFFPAQTLSVFGAPQRGVQIPGGNGGAFTVPGKSIAPNQVTLSNASLTSSLITFFSPEKTVASCGVDCAGGGCEVFLENKTGATVTLVNRQQDCCLEPHQLICDGECKSYLTDTQNCGGCGVQCAWDEFCGEGACQPICPGAELCGDQCIDTLNDPLNCGGCGIACDAGDVCDQGVCHIPCDKTICGDACVDLTNDPLNCGACGNVCGVDNICTGGACVECKPPNRTACNNVCVNTHSDPLNCGGCGNVCDRSNCPGTPECSQGTSCICVPNVTTPTGSLTGQSLQKPKRFRPTGSIRPQSLSVTALSRSKRKPLPEASVPAPGPVSGNVSMAAPTVHLAVEEAPVCDLNPIAQVVPNGGRYTQDQPTARFGKEIQTTISIVKDGKKVAEGPCPLIVPVNDVDTSGVILSPVSVATRDTSGDSLCQPGEPRCDFFVGLSDVGDSPCNNPLATLSSPPDQYNTNQVAFLNAVSNYPSLPGYPGDGQPLVQQTNTLAFSLTAPLEQASDVGRVFSMSVSCSNLSEPVVVPLTLGIGSKCDPVLRSKEDYDGLVGFGSPVSAALTQGGPVNYSTGSFNQGKTIPLKLSLKCGAQILAGTVMAFKPEIVSLTHETLGPQPLTGINGANNANPDDPLFSCGSSGCDYQFRTNPLPPGRYVIGVKMPDSRVFQAGFTIKP